MEFYFNHEEHYFSLIDTYTVMASDNQSWLVVEFGRVNTGIDSIIINITIREKL